MPLLHRVLDPAPISTLEAYEEVGGGRGLLVAREAGPEAALAVLESSGLRGRGGAGFPTAAKWRTIAAHLTEDLAATVVVNTAEGEPGTFKDRVILRTNPYRVLEGTLIAAITIGADEVVVATKQRFGVEVERLRRAAAEIAAAGWAPEIAIDVVEGPGEYLYGEETALLEVVEGRQPFPRVAPPWRRGVDATDEERDAGGATARAELGGTGDDTSVPPTLVNNVETLANVALIFANGAEWFRQVGTKESPGTIVCTVTGSTKHSGVGEVPMGTPLSVVINEVGGGARGRPAMVLSGVSNRMLPRSALDTPLTYEAMAAAGSGLGTAGFIVVDDSVDPVTVAHGVSRFLAVESCGQCTPCKDDGARIAEALDRLRARRPLGDELPTIAHSLSTIEDGARCYLATQHRAVVESLMAQFPDAMQAAADHTDAPAGEPYLIAELVDILDGHAVYDEGHLAKQPDWTFDETDSGQAPADRLQRVAIGSRNGNPRTR